jgi:hypothetical protein
LRNAIVILLEVSETLGFTVLTQRLARHFDGGVYITILKDGDPAVELIDESTNTLARLIPQRSYTRQGTTLRSISFTQIPDITVEISRVHEAPRLLLFDPKYKLQSEEQGEIGDGKPKKVDIDTMHAYRDAVRDSEQQRIVDYAAILFPGPEVRYGHGIEALSARPLEPRLLQQRLREVLINALTPPGDTEAIEALES